MKVDVDTRERSRRWKHLLMVIAVLCTLVGGTLMLINLYGLTQPVRKPGLGITDHEELRHIPEEVWTYQQSLAAIDALETVGPGRRLVEEANDIVNQSLVHVDWYKVDAEAYRQLVPVWENYFLFTVGHFFDMPQFERYHYTDYQRSIERGIGMCGDASMVLSSILDRYGIENRIVSFQGHVIVGYRSESGGWELVDPDFGVNLGVTLAELQESNALVRARYQEEGYSENEIDVLISAFNTDYKLFEGASHFMSKRYIFERVSYILKWLLPIFLIAVGSLIFWWLGRRGRSEGRSF